MKPPAIIYCHCQYARVLPEEVKQAVLRKLCESGQPFEAVADLCELSARKDPALARLAAAGPVKIAACFPRALKWLFASASAPLSLENTEVVNLRTLTADDACAALFNNELSPNLPAGKETISTAGAGKELGGSLVPPKNDGINGSVAPSKMAANGSPEPATVL